MSTSDKPHPLVRAATLVAGTDYPFRHPLNPASEIHFRGVDGKSMSELAGLERVSVYTARIPPGRESFVYHSHRHEEEFLYVLAGRGVVEIGEDSYEIGPGDFLGFPAGGPAHLVKNPFEADLVVLAGGERRHAEVADFPRHGKRLVRSGDQVWLVDADAMKDFPSGDQ